MPCVALLSWESTIVTNVVTKCLLTSLAKLFAPLINWYKLMFMVKQEYEVILCHKFNGSYCLTTVEFHSNNDTDDNDNDNDKSDHEITN